MLLILMSLSFNQIFNLADSVKIKSPTQAVRDGECRIKVSESGYILIGDLYDKNIYIYSKDGNFLDTFAREGRGPDEVTSVGALNVKGDTLFVRQRGGRFSIFSVPGGNVKSMVLSGAALPFHIDFDDSGNIYLTVYKRKFVGEHIVISKMMKKYTGEGDLLHSFFQPPVGFVEYGDPYSETVIPSVFGSTIWLFAQVIPQIWIYTLDGKLLRTKHIESEMFFYPEPMDRGGIRGRSGLRKRWYEWRESWTPLVEIAVDNRGNRVLAYSQKGGDGYFLVGYNNRRELLFKDVETKYELLCSDKKGNFYFWDKADEPMIRVYKLKVSEDE